MPRERQPQADELAAQLSQIAEAIVQVRALGLDVRVPPDLVEACAAVVELHAELTSLPHAEPKKGLLQAVPLRRLLWRVITAGEDFTVGEVAERLAQLGVHRAPNVISNALGYWVERRRLTRVRKGVYRCQLNSVVDDPEGGIAG